MAEPISITAGVLGIVNTSGSLIKNLYDLGINIKEAQSDANKVAKEVSSIAKVMESLQSYILGRVKASPQMLQYITLEDIESSLTDCILTYSELRKLLEELHVTAGMKAWDRAKWLLKRDRIGTIISRLQNQKVSFTLMLSILQSTSMSEAQRATEELCNIVNELFRSNQGLSRRMGNLEELMRSHMGASSVRNSISARSSSDEDSRSTWSADTMKQKRPSLDDAEAEWIILLLPAAWFIRRESYVGQFCIIVVYFAAIAYFIFKLVRMYIPARVADYQAARPSLTTFAILTLLLVNVTIGVVIACMMIFNKGLKPHI